MYGYGYKINSGLVVGAGGGAPFTNTYSLDFDGVDDYVDCGDITELDNVTSASWSMWANSNITSSYHNLISCFSTGFNQYLVRQYSTRLEVYISQSSGTLRLMNKSNFSFTAGTWFHIAIIYDESEASNSDKVKVYIDGVLQSNTVAGFALTSMNTSRGNATEIGKAGGYTTKQYNGNIDEVAIFNSAVSIGDLWNGSGEPTDLSLLSTPPVHWYRNGDNGSYKSPQWLIPSNENFAANKVSNYSFELDGVDDKIELGNPSSLQITGAFSFSCWVNTTSTNYEGIYFKGNSVSLSDIYIRRQNNGTVRFFINNVSKNVTSSTTVNDGNWHHIMCVYVPSTSMTIYIDGSQDAQNTTTIPSAINNNYGNISIGEGGGQLFNGKIDEASIFNTDQSANISTIYNGGTPTTLPSGAIAHYKMGEDATFSGGVWTVPDSAGSNNGTSNGMTIEDRVGDAPNSTSNALSYNMDEVDRVEDTP